MVWFKVKHSNTGKYKHGVALIKAFTVYKLESHQQLQQISFSYTVGCTQCVSLNLKSGWAVWKQNLRHISNEYDHIWICYQVCCMHCPKIKCYILNTSLCLKRWTFAQACTKGIFDWTAIHLTYSYDMIH